MKQVKVKDGMTQFDIVEKHLAINPKQGITDNDARDLYGINRLAAIVWVLKNKRGCRIKSADEMAKNRYGKMRRFSRYTMEKPA